MLRVGSGQTYPTLASAVASSQDGDTLEIVAGTYTADVAALRRNRITLRGVGGQPVFDAGGASSEGKAILVIGGDDVRIENIALKNAAVPDRNGAGIRFENGQLVVCKVLFEGNENGILAGNDGSATLQVHDSRFIRNGLARSGGQAHGAYIGRIASFRVQGSYFTGTEVGHLLKSRARVNRILYNRLTSEGSTSSYELDLPEAGDALVSGNLIEQSAATQNGSIITFGVESMTAHPVNTLALSYNTIVNRRTNGCTWVFSGDGASIRAINNALVGGDNCSWRVPASAVLQGNLALTNGDFVNAAGYDFRPNRAVPGGAVTDSALLPQRQYVHPASSAPRVSTRDVGAFSGP